MKIGAAKQDMTCEIDGVGMLGYGKEGNIVRGVASRQYARAFVWQNGDAVFAYLVADICFVTDALKDTIINELNRVLPHVFCYENVMLTAQHTHSGAGGFGQHFFYNLPFKGFRKDVLAIYAAAMALSIVNAYKNASDATMQFTTGEFDDAAEIGINRSLDAYNNNADVTEKRKPEEAAFAMDRTMQFLQFIDNEQNIIGNINWFGMHTTSMSNDNTLICADNKGFAAAYLEDFFYKNNQKNTISAFAQSTAGDITPNYVYDEKKKWMRGKFENDLESAQFNGYLQYDLAKKLAAQNPAQHKLSPASALDYIACYIDWSDMEASPEFTPQNEIGKRTAPSCLGMAFLEGTAEGPGAPKLLGVFAKKAAHFLHFYETNLKPKISSKNKTVLQVALHKYEAQHPKSIVLEMQARRLLLAAPRKVIIPRWADTHVRLMKEIDELGLAAQQNWLPHEFQLQILILNDLAILGMPCEVTTIAGKRLRETVAPILAKRGVKTVIIQAYANGYAGYLTTYEEYQLQRYEGGHTPFGKWSLAAVQTQLQALAQQLLLPKETRKYTHFPQKPTLLADEIVW